VTTPPFLKPTTTIVNPNFADRSARRPPNPGTSLRRKKEKSRPSSPHAISRLRKNLRTVALLRELQGLSNAENRSTARLDSDRSQSAYLPTLDAICGEVPRKEMHRSANRLQQDAASMHAYEHHQ